MMKTWFLRQTRRDQVALLICSVFVGAVIVWLTVLQPLHHAAERSGERHQAAMTRLAEVRQLAARVREQEAGGGPAQDRSEQGGAAARLDRTASEHGLRIASLEPATGGRDRVSVRMREVTTEAALRWIDGLETGEGMTLDHLSLSPSGDDGNVDLLLRVMP